MSHVHDRRHRLGREFEAGTVCIPQSGDETCVPVPISMIPPVRTDPVWGRAQSGPVPPEGRTGLSPRLAVLDWTGLVWTDPFTHIILSLLFSQVLPKT